ncbi:hypothetical protein TKK_0000155 [Trichogramma kaykai]
MGNQQTVFLRPEDYPKRVRFCEWMLNKIAEDDKFLEWILFTDELIGPIDFPPQVTTSFYRDFIEYSLQDLLQSNNVVNDVIFQHDTAPIHTAKKVVELLDELHPERWIGARGDVDSMFSWPKRSADLNPVYYFYYAAIRSQIYTEEIRSLEDLKEKISRAAATVTSEMLSGVRTNFIMRLQKCIEMGGGRFEPSM